MVFDMNWYFEALKKYAVFNGRARRKEYWWFVLGNFLVSFAAGFSGVPDSFYTFYDLIMFVPGLAVTVRRLHDTDHSGWWMLVPFVNLILMFFGNQRDDNRFGPNPIALRLRP